MKRYVSSSLSEQQMYSRWNAEQSIYKVYKDKPDIPLNQVWCEIAKKYSPHTADSVCWMLDVYDGRK